jgi:hypothetical protein
MTAEKDCFARAAHEGCQIFQNTKYQNGGKYTKLPQNKPKDSNINHRIDKMSIKYTNILHFKTLQNLPK